nr:Ig-like domain-containing protein [Vibrio vulnificus]
MKKRSGSAHRYRHVVVCQPMDGEGVGAPVANLITKINGVELTGSAQSIAVDNGTVVIAADGTMTFEPADDFNGEINFGYEVKDADGDVDSANVKVTVTSEDDAVVANDDQVTVAEDGSITPLVTPP